MFKQPVLFLASSSLLALAACGALSPIGGESTVPTSTTATVQSKRETDFTVRLENIAPFTNLKTGSFSTKVGGSAPGPLAPGESFKFTFTAGLHSRLVFAAMFGQSNDWFFATNPNGIALFDHGTPIRGDVTSQVGLYDAGTQIDEEPAVGPHTGPNRASSTDGPGAPDPNPLVRRVPMPTPLSTGVVFNTPKVAQMLQVTVISDAPSRLFTVTITNCASDTNTLLTSQGYKPVRVSPGVWAVGTGSDPIFTLGSADRGEGLKHLAEMGDYAALATTLPSHSGVATAFSPGVWVVHGSGMPLFTDNAKDYGKGLTDIAEKGDVTNLAAALQARLPAGASATGVFNTPVGGTGPGPIVSGGAYEFTLTAVPGDRLSLATMFGWSTDWFFGPADDGIPLFAGETPIHGDVSSSMQIWNDGAVLSEAPETGVHVNALTGAPPDPVGTVRVVPSDEYSTPADQHLLLTVTPR